MLAPAAFSVWPLVFVGHVCAQGLSYENLLFTSERREDRSLLVSLGLNLLGEVNCLVGNDNTRRETLVAQPVGISRLYLKNLIRLLLISESLNSTRL